MNKCENAEMSKCENTMLVRIAEIEVNEGYLEEYLAAAHNVGTKSVESEPGVICIFPMQVKESQILGNIQLNLVINAFFRNFAAD